VSLYTCLNILNQPGINIRPRKTRSKSSCRRQPGQRQREVGAVVSDALRAFLRQDPDIVMVGEVRDLETADIAIKAAQTATWCRRRCTPTTRRRR
jgi:type IV pilus assembly protein PilB